jgi:hypothetical protein
MIRGIVLTAALVLTPSAAWAHHDGYDERSRCGYDYECSERGDYSGDQEYDQWNSDQRNHNGRERGAFSPGPFDDSPVDAFNGNTICLPGSTCTPDDRQREEQPPR